MSVAALEATVRSFQCGVCMEALRRVAVLPCRHMVLCDSATCAEALGAQRRCLICHQAVTKVVPLFL